MPPVAYLLTLLRGLIIDAKGNFMIVLYQIYVKIINGSIV